MNNRELLAKEISKRFVDAISGNNVEQIIEHNPEDRIYVGKLSPTDANEESVLSSNVLIKQIGVMFKIPKADIDTAQINIYPKGNFFYRVIPTLEQQREYFIKDFNQLFDSKYGTFDDLTKAYFEGELTNEMIEHKVQALPVYQKIAIDRKDVFFSVKIKDHYNKAYNVGAVAKSSTFCKKIDAEIAKLADELSKEEGIMPCQFRDKIKIVNLLTIDSWEKYIEKQKKREEHISYTSFNYSLDVDMRGIEDYVSINVTLSNETTWQDESQDKIVTKSKNDRYRISTLFNSGIKITCEKTKFLPITLDYFADDYKYDANVYALGKNCNVNYDVIKSEIQTTHVPEFIQHRLKTKDDLAVSFEDLINEPINTLKKIHKNMLLEVNLWEKDFASGKNPTTKEDLTDIGKTQFANEIEGFKTEIKRFKTGIELIEKHNMVRQAFCLMNQTFKQAAKGYHTWRLFQIVFIVSLILDIVAHEPDLMIEDELVQKAKTEDVDILYFPTGGGKTEAFLGIMIFNLFFDRIRGKECGVTAILKYPLRLLSVQQVQRVSNILAVAELIRLDNNLYGDKFAIGYFVGEGNTPNSIKKDQVELLKEMTQTELDSKYKLLDVCPFCGECNVHVEYNEKQNSLIHCCKTHGCSSGGTIPLYMVDDDIYRFLPSVIISTVDKMTAISFNSRFHNIISGAEYKCPEHGYTDKTKCLVSDCCCDAADFKQVYLKDPAPSLLIQDELHLIKESLGTYAGHYETLIDYFIKKLSRSNRGIKVIGATATISAYEEQAKHLYWKNSIRFPAASPYLDHNFYSRIDHNDICRIIFGYAPFGKAIVNSVAYSLQYLKRVIWELYQEPQQIIQIKGMDWQGSDEERINQAKRLIEEYWIILEYSNVKMESNKVLQALEDPINTELNEAGVQPLISRNMTGDETFQEVRATLSDIEHAKNIITDIDFNMIAATSMISHGVDADRFNLMVFYGIPGSTAEYIQAYSRVGRKHTGVVIDIIRPSREKDRSYLKNFQKFHEYKDILVDSVSINRWATNAVKITLPGVVAALLLNYYSYKLKYEEGMKDISKFSDLQKAIKDNKITIDEIKEHVYNIYKCSEDDSSIGRLYKQTIDQSLLELFDKLLTGSFAGSTYIGEVFKKCDFHIMNNLRDTNKQIIIEMR